MKQRRRKLIMLSLPLLALLFFSAVPCASAQADAVSASSYTLLQYVVFFALALIFSLIALMSDNSVVANALAMLLWVVFAISNFLIAYTVIGSSLSFILGLVGFIFAGNFILSMYHGWADHKKSRFQF